MAQYANYSTYGKTSLKKSTLLEINSENKETILKDTEKPIVCIYMTADWCAPCKIVSPLFEKLEQELSNRKYNNVKCNLVKENVDLMLTDTVSSIPAFYFYKDGNLIHKIVAKNKEEPEQLIQNVKNTLNTCISNYNN